MARFGSLAQLEQQGDKTLPYTLDQIKGSPTIEFLPATAANKAFWNESLRRINVRAAANRRAKKLTTESITSARGEDRELFATYCAKAWYMKDDKGKQVPFVDDEGEAVEFSADNCLEYLQALPDWLFDDIRTFVTDPANFTTVAGGDQLGEA